MQDREQPNPDPVALLEQLRLAGVDDDYTDIDQHRDFRRVFMDSPRGRRVLQQIFEMGNLFAPVALLPADPYEAYHRDGARNLALNILAILISEPNTAALKASEATSAEDAHREDDNG